MAEDPGIGKLIERSDAARDAIHIAVAPMIAAESLDPGDHVGLVDETTASKGAPHIGIVDPYLSASVGLGERFWMFLYPRTITTLRHEWAHPAWANLPGRGLESRRWIESFAAELDQTYNRLMIAADRWVDEEEYTYDNTETYKEVDDQAKWETFWRHWEIVSGRSSESKRGVHFFTCSC